MNFHFFLRADRFEECAVTLAQGLIELGHTVSANVSYWQEFNGDSNFLFKAKNASELIVNEDVLVYTSKYLEIMNQPPSIYRQFTTVLIDSADGGRHTPTKHFAELFGIVLKCHYNRRYRLPKNVIPWSFSLPRHSLEKIEQLRSLGVNRKHIAKVSFRNNHQMRNHGLELVQKSLRPYIFFESEEINRQWSFNTNSYLGVTYPRLDPRYYEGQVECLIGVCFGGWIEFSDNKVLEVLERILVKTRLGIPKLAVFSQFDSWRLWESFALGQVVITFDFEKYDCVLPVQPANGEQYIGIDMKGRVGGRDIANFINEFESIALEGNKFFVENYSPLKIASRFVSIL